MKLDEILSRPTKFKVLENNAGEFVAEFTSGGRKIQFNATNEGELDGQDEGEWFIGFGEVVSQKRDGPEYTELSYDKTGSGSELEVFATLKAVLAEFLRERKPEKILFSADKDEKNNRARVYAKLFRRNLPAGWRLSKDETEGSHEPVLFTLVKEALDRALPYNVLNSDAFDFNVEFRAGKRNIVFTAEYMEDGAWEIAFAERKDGKKILNFDLTKGGNELEVFATIGKIIKDFTKSHRPKSVHFAAATRGGQENRASLYNRLARQFFPGWEIHRDEDDGVVFFTVVNEALDKPLPYDVTNKSAKFFDARFKAGDRWIDFIAQFANSTGWEVSFEEQTEKSSTSRATGSGNEFQVFATIKAIIDQFIAEYKPAKITIDSFKGEANRARLYQRMIKKFLPQGWKMERDDKHPSYTTFTMVKEGMMKRSDPYISGERSGPRPPDMKLTPAPRTAHKSKLETLQRQSGKTMAQVEAAWNRAARDVPDGPAKWAKVMLRAKSDLGIGA